LAIIYKLEKNKRIETMKIVVHLKYHNTYLSIVFYYNQNREKFDLIQQIKIWNKSCQTSLIFIWITTIN